MTRPQIAFGIGIIVMALLVLALAHEDHAIRGEYRRWADTRPVQKVDREACLRRKKESGVAYFNYRALCTDFVAAPPPEEIPPANLWEAVVGR